MIERDSAEKSEGAGTTAVARVKKRQDVAALLTSRVGKSHDALDETVTTFTLSAEGASAPENEAAQFALGVIFGGLDAFVVQERPERLSMLEQVRT